MSKRNVMLVLGSGATVGSNFTVDYNGERWQPPMDRNFFETPLVQALFTEERYPALSWYQRRPSLEETWSIVDLHAKLAYGNVISEEEAYRRCDESMRQRATMDPSYRLKLERESSLWRVPGMAGWEIRELVLRTYGEIRAPDRNDCPLKTVIDAIWNRGILYGIVSFNYDTSVERLLSDRLVYVIPGRSDDPAGGKIPLYKLHGSLNWKESPGKIEPKGIDDPGPVKMNFTWDGGWIQPSIIGPTLFKQEIAVDFQRNELALFYKRLWRMSWDALREVDALVFIGFSFPSTDFHVRALFESVHRVRPFRRVLMCTMDDEAALEKGRGVFPGARMVDLGRGIADMAKRVGEVVGFLTGTDPEFVQT